MTDAHEGYRAGREDTAYRRLDRTVLAVTGDDAAGYLDRALTAAVGDLSPTSVGRGLLLDGDGRARALVTVVRREDGFLVLAATVEELDLAAEWRDNVFIDDVAIEETDRGVVTVQGPAARDDMTAIGMGVPDDAGLAPGAIGGVGPVMWRRDRSPAGGYDLVTGDADALTDRLADAGGIRCDDLAADALRAAARVPSFDAELAGRLPLGMAVADAIDHDERCYVGQEVVARIHQRAGGPTRRLVRLEAAGRLDPGTAVLDAEDGAVGEVTTAAAAPDLGPIALAVLDDDAPRRLRAADGTPLRRVDTADGLADDTSDGAREASP